MGGAKRYPSQSYSEAIDRNEPDEAFSAACLEELMEFANINETMRMANDENKRFVPLFGNDNFRSWILYFQPGDHTDMHYHLSPETFLVLQGKASVKSLKGEERIIEKNEIVFFGAKDYYQITNVGTEPLVLVGNRSEAFGGAHVTAKE
jgi:mannose-6-phosphate isomerase-like protein (cupin superfamily)